MLQDDEFRAFLKTLGIRIRLLRKEKGLHMRDIMISSGYYDAQWRKYESGGSLNVESLLKVALALNVSLSVLLDGLGQWPLLSVAEIQAQHGIRQEPMQEPGLEPVITKKPSSGKNGTSLAGSGHVQAASPNVIKTPAVHTTQADRVQRKRTSAK